VRLKEKDGNPIEQMKRSTVEMAKRSVLKSKIFDRNG